MIQKIKQGEIWLANLNPTRGTEPGKCRPVLIVQNQALLDIQHPSTLIVPLTTRLIDKAEPLRIRIKAQSGLKQDSDFLVDQIRSIDNKRLIDGPLFRCKEKIMQQVYEAIHEVMGMSDY
ncbi:MAG TPA: type II toxin-antitoxin system PemK/MazF family toxin [Gammaproteobacteria bacterium]|nr:type II toxin-antitoxin system PemK/MazF family toxin [Gammaproteobacteria bacterium]